MKNPDTAARIREIEAEARDVESARNARSAIGGDSSESRAIFIENCNRRLVKLGEELDKLRCGS